MSYDSAVVYIFFNLLVILFILSVWYFIRIWWSTILFMLEANVVQMFFEKSLDNHERKRKKKRKRK
tara:strand:- start:271 stop:468 length:198 start_codon:yes stop_codon:yes gene_type:complete